MSELTEQWPPSLGRATDHLRSGRLDEAESLLNAVLEQGSATPDALHLLGRVALQRGQLERAAGLIDQAIAQQPDNARHFRLRAENNRGQRRFPEAAAAARRVAALQPDDARAQYELGVALGPLGDIAGIRAATERAIQLSPDWAPAHFMRATALLLASEFAEGWAEYEWRLRLSSTAGGIPPDDWRRWDGTPLPQGQRLLLFADQGRGDIIQFCRYIDWAADRCPDIVIACPGEMWPILRQFSRLRGMVEHWY